MSEAWLRQIDRLVAERVMEWRVQEPPGLFSDRFQAWCRQLKSGQWWPIVPVDDWHPTTDRGQAMMVFERCEWMDLQHQMDKYAAGQYYDEDWQNAYSGPCDTPMLAVCLSSLKWADVEVPSES